MRLFVYKILNAFNLNHFYSYLANKVDQSFGVLCPMNTTLKKSRSFLFFYYSDLNLAI